MNIQIATRNRSGKTAGMVDIDFQESKHYSGHLLTLVTYYTTDDYDLN